MAFFSSPLASNYYCQAPNRHQAQAQTFVCTPPFKIPGSGTTNVRWSPSSFTPKSPSPLRTSRNANLNLQSMPSPPPSTSTSLSPFTPAQMASEGQENMGYPTPAKYSEPSPGLFSTPVGSKTTSLDMTSTSTTSSSFLGPGPSLPSNIPTPASAYNTSTATASATTKATQFQFSARARSSSPAVQLQSTATAKRTDRKRLFLDRIKTQRDEAQFARAGDHMLRLEWQNERRAWELQMAQQRDYVDEAMEEVEHEDETPDKREEDMEEEEEMSPTEEKELEELASLYDAPSPNQYLIHQHQQQQQPQQPNQPVTHGEWADEDFFSDESDDYDALMLVLSQQESALDTGAFSGVHPNAGGSGNVGPQMIHPPPTQSQSHPSGMPPADAGTDTDTKKTLATETETDLDMQMDLS